MKYREAEKLLLKKGFTLIRKGNGSHMIFEKNKIRIVLPYGGELSLGMSGKVRSILNKKG